MRVRFSDRALRDLDAIHDWIARDDPVRAQSFVAELIDAAEGTATFPNRFPVLNVQSSRPVRHRVHGNYLILFSVTDPEIEILAVVHGARDLDALP